MDTAWTLLHAALDSSGVRTLFIDGPPGIGKTLAAYRRGLNGRAVYAITLTEDTPAAELRGHFIPKGGEFVWHDGPAIRAMREGARLVLNEVTHAGPDVHSILYAILESAETARITLPTGETVRPAPGFQCVLTDNAGLHELAPALRDRIDARVSLTEPAQEAIESFPENLRQVIAESAKADGERRISLRSWEALGRLTDSGLTFDVAGSLVFGVKRWKGLETSLAVAIAGKV